MEIASWSNPISRMRVLGWTTESETLLKEPTYYPNKQWELVSLGYKLIPANPDISSVNSNYDRVKLNFRLKRQAESIIKMIFVPGVMVSSLSVFCYLLPMEGPVRVKFIIQVLLNMVVLTILLTTHLPISRSKILLVDIFQALIILIYSILVYILCIEKYRTYQISLSKEFQTICEKIDIEREKMKLKDATREL